MSYIKFHKFNKYFKFILLTSIFRYLNCCILGYNFNGYFTDVSLVNLLYHLFDINEKINLSDYRVIEFFFKYLATLICSFITRFYELSITQESARYFFKYRDSFAETQIKVGQLTKEEIKKDDDIKENILSKFKNYLLINTSFGLYIFISLIWVAEEMTMFAFFDYLKDLDFWFIEILIVIIFYSKIFLVQIYKHQKFSIILNLIPSLLKITCIILTLVYDEKERLYDKDNKWWWIPVGFLMHSFLTAVISFVNCSLKSFLDLKYTTTSQLLMVYSFVGIIVSFIICTFGTFVHCSTNSLNDNNDNKFINIVCPVKEDNYYYIDNIRIYFETFLKENSQGKFIRSIAIILDSLTFFLHKYFLILSIKYTDPVHIYFYIPIYYLLQKVVLVINNAIINHECFNIGDNFKIAKYFLDVSGDTFCIIGLLIYFEIIELNFCDLNYDLKMNIAKRGISEGFSFLNATEEDENNKEEENEIIEKSYETSNDSFNKQ